MDIRRDWQAIQQVFDAALASSKHCAIASVDVNGVPHITPIGFLFLRDDCSAYYFEQYSKRLPENYKSNANVCLMVVNSDSRFWFKALFTARFAALPGVRLYGRAGDLRPASAAELTALQRRIGPAKHLPGAKLIWSGLRTVRDIALDRVEPVRYPKIMEHLLEGA
jgi:hypothetical protein